MLAVGIITEVAIGQVDITDNLSKGMFVLNVKQAGVSVLCHKVRK
jgi:hypothetical protein